LKKHIKFIKRLSAVMLAGILPLVFFSASVHADTAGTVDFYGQDALGNTSPNGEWKLTAPVIYTADTGEEITDLFGEITKNLLPGDVRNFTVKLTNNSDYTVLFTMKATPVTRDREDGVNSDDLTAGGSFGDKTPMTADDLLDVVTVTIKNPFNDDAVLYQGSMRGDGDGMYGAAGTPLGNVSAESSGYIDVTVNIPRELGNEYQNAFAAVEWVFIAEYDIPVPTTTTAAPTEAPTDPPTTTTTAAPTELFIIDEEDPPLDAPKDVEKEYDYEVVIPKTGDRQDVFTVAAVSAASLLGLIVITALIVRENRRKKYNYR